MEPMPPAVSPVLDRDYLSTICEGDHEFERELAESYLEATPSVVQSLRDAVATSDADGVRAAAHTLKGSSRSIGAQAVADVCATMEDRGRDGDLRDASELLGEVEQRVEILFEYIRTTWKTE